MTDAPPSHNAPPPASCPWAEPATAALARLGVDRARGLDPAEAARRLAAHGPNLLRHARRRSAGRILWDQLATPITVLLVAAAVAALAFDERAEALAIGVVLLLNAAIGYATERRAVRSMEALRALGQAEAVVRRGGTAARVPARELVPGDVLLLDAGDVLAADARVLVASRLQVDESALTGESLPVEKGPESVERGAALPERACMLHKGTALTRGTAEALVVATGMETELGRISALVEEAEAAVTPLERRLQGLARRLIALTVAIAVLVAAALLVTERGLLLAVETGIALAVATIPEGLPIVATVALARGMWRMARRNALVENLAAVETLGSTTVVLTDKTGTLTENRMTLVALELAGGAVVVEGVGPGLEGRFLRHGEALDANADHELATALRVAVLCNDAALARAAEADGAVGDPTEVALLVAGAKAGLSREALRERWPRLGELAFDSETKRMATLHAGDGEVLAAVKGAPEALLSACSRVLVADREQPLSGPARAAWEARVDALAAGGRRVLALATRRVPGPAAFAYEDLTLVGLVGLEDPPRASAGPAVDAFRAAGIRVVLVTGDHAATAWSVANEVGLVRGEAGGAAGPVDCRALQPAARWGPDERAALHRALVLARATPEQKLDLIALHQAAGAVVAMTGDGVNDAPALKKADIGVAMGLRGTQVAREAADMVLKDDELGTIAVAVAEGRAIFANLRKFVVYLLSCNVSEILVVGVGALLPGPLPLLPLQILFLNLVTDVFPALALGVCEGSPALATAPPRDPAEPVLARRHWRRIFGLGLVMAVSVLAAYTIAWQSADATPTAATTAAFLTLSFAQLWHVLSMRNPRSHPLANEVTRNAWVWGALALCVALLLLAVHWSPLAGVLGLAPPGPRGWAVALAASLVPLAAGQLALLRRGVGVR